MQEDERGCRRMVEDTEGCRRRDGCRRTEEDGGWLEEMVSFRLHARGTKHKSTSSFHSLMKSNYCLKDVENSLTSRPNQERPVGRRKSNPQVRAMLPRHPSV